MKVVKTSETISFSNSPVCSGYEYVFGDKDLNLAIVTVDGRFPEHGNLVNEACQEIAYVLSGSGTIGVDSDVHELGPGNAVLVQPGERFCWQGECLTMLMPCSPAFYPEQHKEVA